MTLALHHPPPTRDEITLRWLDELYRDVDDGWVSLFSVERDEPTAGKRNVDWAPIGGLDVLAAIAIDRSLTCCVWFGVATRRENLGLARGGAADCVTLPALWVDIDVAGPNHADSTNLPTTIEDAWRLVRSFPEPATAVIATGGGLQAWWFLAEPAHIDAGTTTLLARWHATWDRLGGALHVDNVFDVARVMRLPGTSNRKHAAVDVEILECDYERRYGLDDLDRWLDDPPAPPEPSRARDVPYIGPERPGDAYSARHTGGQVLAELGFTLDHRDSNGDEQWTRPGKDARQGTSATVYAEDGHTTIWSDTCAARWPKLQVRRPYDPFGLLVVTRYDGDWHRAYEELLSQGYGSAPERIDPRALMAGLADVAEPTEGDDLTQFLDPDIDEFLAGEEPPYDWVIPDVAESGDRIILTGEEGKGKSTLLRQIAVQVATGIHPFTGEPIEPAKVHIIDCENSRRQTRRKIRPLREMCSELDPSNLRINVVGHALDLAKPNIYQDIALRVRAHQPRLIIIGPLYKMTDGDPTKEEPAKALADALDALRAICGSALLIEAHTPYADGSKSKRPIRPYGASLWSRWPEFGVFLANDGDLEHWRGGRDERTWPRKLERSAPWPWAVGEAGSEPEQWDGPTHCMEALETWFRQRSGEEHTKSSILAKLRAVGLSYRDKTVVYALEMLVAKDVISWRKGARNADLYSYGKPVDNHAF